MDYFALDRPKIFMPLLRSATAAKFPDVDLEHVKTEGDWHPHVVLDARPTKGALDFVLRYQGAFAEAATKARARVTPMVDDELSRVTPEEIKQEIAEEWERALEAVKVPAEAERALNEEQLAGFRAKNAAPRYRNPREYRNHLIGTTSTADAALLSAMAETTAVRVAVCIHEMRGDWSCYASTWGDASPVWPRLDEPDALERRLAIVARLAGEDIERINEAAEKVTEIGEEGAGKSEGRLSSSTTAQGT